LPTKNGRSIVLFAPPVQTLVRRLSRLDGLAIGIGAVVGTGIFRTTGDALRGAGGFAGATAIWVGVGLVSGAGALVYAEMAARVPEAGGGYAYVREAFGRYPAFVDGGLDAFVSNPTRQAASTMALGELVSRLLGVDHPRAFAVLTLLVLLAITLPGVLAGAAVQRVTTALRLAAFAGVVVLAVVAKPALHAAPPLSPLPLAVALGAAWYSYLGWQDVALLAEELDDPQRHLKTVLIGTVATVTVGYVAVHVAVWLGLGGTLAASGSFPALDLARAVFGSRGETLMTCVIATSMFGGAAESLFIRPRIAFALARDGLAPRSLAHVNRGGTPSAAMGVHAALTLGLILTGTFHSLLALLVFVQAVTGLAEASSVFRLRTRAAAWSTDATRAPVAAWLFVAGNAALCAVVVWQEPLQVVYALAAVAAVTVVYFLRRRERLPGDGG
jgi:basic amino acid/polyamine antiporter, APA family